MPESRFSGRSSALAQKIKERRRSLRTEHPSGSLLIVTACHHKNHEAIYQQNLKAVLKDVLNETCDKITFPICQHIIIMSMPPVIGFAAYSGTGKTTLLEKVIPLLAEKGLNVGLVKASHHSIELDKPGKDSYRLRQAGASQLLLSTPDRSICFTERAADVTEPSLEEQLKLLNHEQLDIIIVEGFREAPIPKIELHRHDLERPYLFTIDPNIIAIATDSLIKHIPTKLTQLDINCPETVSAFVIKQTGLERTINDRLL